MPPVRGKSSVCFYGRGKHMRNHPKVMSAVLTFLCALLTASAAFAATPSVMDRAHLLSETERRALSAKIAAIEEKYDVRIVVGTQKSIQGDEALLYGKVRRDNPPSRYGRCPHADDRRGQRDAGAHLLRLWTAIC